jgi:hypothetical protein
MGARGKRGTRKNDEIKGELDRMSNQSTTLTGSGNTRVPVGTVLKYVGRSLVVLALLALIALIAMGLSGGGSSMTPQATPPGASGDYNTNMRAYINDVIKKHGPEKLTASDSEAILYLDDQLMLGNNVTLNDVNIVLRNIGVSDDVMTSVMNSYTPEIQLLLKDPALLIPPH